MPFGSDPESPDNEWTRLYEHGLKPLETRLDGLPAGLDHSPVRLWRSDRQLSSLALRSNVIRGIQQCSCMLAVLTTSLRRGATASNPNVLWELGYAEACGKPFVVLADTDDLRRLPVLAGVANVCTYNHDLVRHTTAKDAATVLHSIAVSLVPYVARALEEGHDAPSGKRDPPLKFLASPEGDSRNLASEPQYKRDGTGKGDECGSFS